VYLDSFKSPCRGSMRSCVSRIWGVLFVERSDALRLFRTPPRQLSRTFCNFPPDELRMAFNRLSRLRGRSSYLSRDYLERTLVVPPSPSLPLADPLAPHEIVKEGPERTGWGFLLVPLDYLIQKSSPLSMSIPGFDSSYRIHIPLFPVSDVRP